MGLVTATLLCSIVTWVCLNSLSISLGGQIPVELTKKKRWKGKCMRKVLKGITAQLRITMQDIVLLNYSDSLKVKTAESGLL